MAAERARKPGPLPGLRQALPLPGQDRPDLGESAGRRRPAWRGRRRRRGEGHVVLRLRRPRAPGTGTWASDFSCFSRVAISTPSMSGRWTSAMHQVGRQGERPLDPGESGGGLVHGEALGLQRAPDPGAEARGRSRCRGFAGAWSGVPGGGDDSAAARRGLRKTTQPGQAGPAPSSSAGRAPHQSRKCPERRALVFAAGSSRTSSRRRRSASPTCLARRFPAGAP